MTLSFSLPAVSFWVSSILATLFLVMAWRDFQSRSTWGRWKRWKSTGKNLSWALALLLVGLSPWGTQQYAATVVQREEVQVRVSFLEFAKKTGLDGVLPGKADRGEWWAIPYTAKNATGETVQAILLTTGKDATGEWVWLKVQ